MKIGIITLYYENWNYGAYLQAYALCRVINQMDNCEAEQIVFDRKWSECVDQELEKKRKKKDRINRINRIRSYSLVYILQKVVYKIQEYFIQKKIEKRKNAFLRFGRENIPCSEVIYNHNNIHQTNGKYDVFITGSDQVWNPIGSCLEYFLSFVHREKVKFSYGASIAKFELSDKQKSVFAHNLREFQAVSVRESSAIQLLEDTYDGIIEHVLDPTLLLTSEEWAKFTASRIIKQSYVFCYFLGEDNAHRKFIMKLGRKQGLKIVTLPHLLGSVKPCDMRFGDERLYNISPTEFLSLIKYAECIYTDSFHACLFSLVFEKEFITFSRENLPNMEGRIWDLLELYDLKERFCNVEMSRWGNYIEKLEPINYQKKADVLLEKRIESLEFLKKNIQ